MFYISCLTFASCVHFQSTWNDSPVRGFTSLVKLCCLLQESVSLEHCEGKWRCEERVGGWMPMPGSTSSAATKPTVCHTSSRSALLQISGVLLKHKRQEKAKEHSAGADCFSQESARQASRQPGVQSGSCKLLRTSNQVRTDCDS